jgi:hypothetical protein
MIIRPEAEADLVNARDWYERQREGLGAAFLLCVEEVLERIGRTPEMYTAGLSRCAPGIDPPVPVRSVLSDSGQ